MTSYAIVVPTVGRASLRTLLESLAASRGPAPERLVLVDDRPGPRGDLPLPASTGFPLLVLAGGGRGPAAARNTGLWSLPGHVEWVAFLDDDVVVSETWRADLAADLEQPPSIGGVQGRVRVPLPADRAPTDWERATRGLEDGAWITADMAYRRAVLEEVGGFDERFRRAYREDADLALRVVAAGYSLTRGRRQVDHPVRPAQPWTSVRMQAGNADDALMRRRHGPRWREKAECPRGRLPAHLAVTAGGAVGVLGGLAGRRRLALAGLAGWVAGVGEFAWARIAPGPRDRREVAEMVATSVAIPPTAVAQRLRGWWRHRGVSPAAVAPTPAAPTQGAPTQGAPTPVASAQVPQSPVRAVLFDRDGTLIHDVPYNGDPALVHPVAGAREAVRAVRNAGLKVGVVTNQSAIGRGLLTEAEVAAVNARVDELFGGFDVWVVCPHAPDDGCVCRKPGPGMVAEAAERLGLRPGQVLVVGDIGADVDAALAAGAQAVLVPNDRTRPEEVAAAPAVAADLAEAVARMAGVAP